MVDGSNEREDGAVSVALEISEGQEGEGSPVWSGVPVILGNCMVLPIHVADTRQIMFGPEWTHIDHWPNEGGDIEYHVFRRTNT